jgi:hypothetical protein
MIYVLKSGNIGRHTIEMTSPELGTITSLENMIKILEFTIISVSSHTF